ncbi:hypothetical protein [Nocardia mexicana]|uniref:hypothetical protein n=1 Tax=Nocardia mexicana TaxID=279262 RepID=UPI000A4609FA|nr:hypothetical protein [Nocardia mexicana]
MIDAAPPVRIGSAVRQDNSRFSRNIFPVLGMREKVAEFGVNNTTRVDIRVRL